MIQENKYKDIKHIIQLTPQDIERCPAPCNELPKNITDAVNHFVNKHDYKLLHTGTQTSTDEQGNIVHDTIFTLGK